MSIVTSSIEVVTEGKTTGKTVNNIDLQKTIRSRTAQWTNDLNHNENEDIVPEIEAPLAKRAKPNTAQSPKSDKHRLMLERAALQDKIIAEKAKLPEYLGAGGPGFNRQQGLNRTFEPDRKHFNERPQNYRTQNNRPQNNRSQYPEALPLNRNDSHQMWHVGNGQHIEMEMDQRFHRQNHATKVQEKTFNIQDLQRVQQFVSNAEIWYFLRFLREILG